MKKCQFGNTLSCRHPPFFNYKTESKWLYCYLHKLPGMVNVTGKKCEFYLCQESPGIAQLGKILKLFYIVKFIINTLYLGYYMNRFCNTHQGGLNTFFNNGVCCIEQCLNPATYKCNYVASLDINAGNYCQVHKLDAMVLIKQKCEYEGNIYMINLSIFLIILFNCLFLQFI